jgi:dolichyldiphosphatase
MIKFRLKNNAERFWWITLAIYLSVTMTQGAAAKTISTKSPISRIHDNHLEIKRQSRMSLTEDTMKRKSSEISIVFVNSLNASSKWVLAAANLTGVWVYKEDGALIVIGCIAASFFTEKVLKPFLNQARPSNSPLSDPGMPSSHALASFFVAVGWTKLLGNGTLLVGVAAMVSVLRVLCGFHSLLQIFVGSFLGVIFGVTWMKVVKILKYFAEDDSLFLKKCIWSTYSTGSLLFICKIMPSWIRCRNTNENKVWSQEPSPSNV